MDGGLDQADTTDFVCVNRIIAEPWRQCFAVPPVDIEESDSEDPLTEEEWDLVQGYMDQPFHDWGNQREGKGQDKAWWEVDSIVSVPMTDTFVQRVLDHMSSQDEPPGGTHPPTAICSEARPEMALWATWEDHLSRKRAGSLPLK